MWCPLHECPNYACGCFDEFYSSPKVIPKTIDIDFDAIEKQKLKTKIYSLEKEIEELKKGKKKNK